MKGNGASGSRKAHGLRTSHAFRKACSMDDWQQGDLAECVEFGLYEHVEDTTHLLADAPEPGGVYLVTKVTYATHPLTLEPVLCLKFPEWQDYIWTACCFRKVPPKGEDRKVPRKQKVPEPA